MYDGLISKLLYIQSDNGNKTWPLKESVMRLYLRGDIEYRNRFKGLDLIDSVPDELWTEIHDILQETGIKTMPMEKKCKKAKWLSEKALQIAVKRELKSKGKKEQKCGN